MSKASLESYKRFIFVELVKLQRDCKYHLYCQSAEFEIREEMEENRPGGAGETKWAVLCGYWWIWI